MLANPEIVRNTAHTTQTAFNCSISFLFTAAERWRPPFVVSLSRASESPLFVSIRVISVRPPCPSRGGA